MRIGANCGLYADDPASWLEWVKKSKIRAVSAPFDWKTPVELRRQFLDLIRGNDLVIAEVGAWSSIMCRDEARRREAVEYNKRQLALAEEIGARCCVNVSGSAGDVWSGYDPENYSREHYEKLVAAIREIIDSVKPVSTFYTLEPMQWMHPDSPEDYLKMIRDVDRKAFGVHMDFANMINGFERYRDRRAFIEECFRLLGPYIRSIHAKDVRFVQDALCHIEECRPGLGDIDFVHVMGLIRELDEDMPVLAEHLETEEEYLEALKVLREAAGQDDSGQDDSRQDKS